VTLALGVTVNLFVLIPLFLARQHYLLYGFLLPLSVALFTWLNMLTFSRFIDYILPGYYFISYYDYGDLLKFFVVFILITTLLKLSKGWFLLMDARNKLARLEKEHAQAALDLLRKEPIDLIFLDINLPRLSGLNFLKTLERPPMVIFTTAYPEYAVEGFEANAVDYLVKPFSFERFLKAVNKAIEKTRYSQNQSEPQSPDSRQNFILLRADKKLYKVLLSEILYIEATGDYLKVFYTDKHLVVHGTINGFLKKFPQGEFIRVHKSFIISVNQINYIEGNQIRIGSTFIPIGRMYKENVARRLNHPKT